MIKKKTCHCSFQFYAFLYLYLHVIKNEANSSNGKTKVTFWHTHNDDESKTLESIVEDYESKTS
jgi:ABC-type glycerol-3-phosphate transport system substrate-binding protein